jgi:hypothetical protein
MIFNLTPEYIRRILENGVEHAKKPEAFVEGKIVIDYTKDGIVIKIIDLESRAMFRTEPCKLLFGSSITLQGIKILTGITT